MLRNISLRKTFLILVELIKKLEYRPSENLIKCSIFDCRLMNFYLSKPALTTMTFF